MSEPNDRDYALTDQLDPAYKRMMDDCEPFAKSGCGEFAHAYKVYARKRNEIASKVAVYREEIEAKSSNKIAALEHAIVDIEVVHAREVEGLRDALDALDDCIMAFDLPGDHCEMDQSIMRARSVLAASGSRGVRPEDPVGDPYNGWLLTHDGASIKLFARDDTWDIAGIGRREGPTKFYRMEPTDGTITPLRDSGLAGHIDVLK